PVTDSTNYLDPEGTVDSTYRVAVVKDGQLVWAGEEFTPWEDQWMDVPLDKPDGGTTPDGVEYEYSANDVMVGDLDGDGELELNRKSDHPTTQHNRQHGHTASMYLHAYKLDGPQLLHLDRVPHIRARAHYSQPQVFDFASDAKAQVILKTAHGTVD